MRSTVEALVRGAGCATETGIRSCNPLADKKGMEDIACGWHEPGERGNVRVEDHCAVCQLFGSQVLASHVRITDLMVAPDERRRGRPPVEIRDGVAIDRDLRVAASGRKYDFEVVSPGVRFNFEVFVENPKPWLMGLLLIGFEQLIDGYTALGGFTSRGLGRVNLTWSEMTIVGARDLLDGKPGELLQGDALEERFKTYRQALAARAAKGDG
ncbi:MAG: CRISPR-associated RAMP protein [Polyangiaceae bacterium]|nr:CRISPR-associated RAMP protein [Polyangiaceae bacterium]